MSAVNLLSDDAHAIIIKTNEFQPVFHFQAIEKDFQIFKLTLDKPADDKARQKKYLELLGVLEENTEGIEAACQSTKASFLYVMTNKDLSAQKLKQALKQDKWEALSIHLESVSGIEPLLLLRLFFNRLRREESGRDTHSVSGTLSMFDKKWTEDKKNRISALEFSCSQKGENLFLKIRIRSYTSYLLKNSIVFKKKRTAFTRLERLPKILLSQSKILSAGLAYSGKLQK